MDVKQSVIERYSGAAGAREAALCCPVDYDPQYLKVIPQEVIERDYGCGDPSEFIREGETVLDLGSGGGKICFIAAQKVGPQGKVIGVDMNDDMLNLARQAQKTVAGKIGYDVITFHKGQIEDLKFNPTAFLEYLSSRPVNDLDSYEKAESFKTSQSKEKPLIEDDSIDVVVSNCVLNLVHPDSKTRMFKELFRVLKRGGRAVISDIISDEVVPKAMMDDPELWSGCISGALQEHAFLEAFADAGFYGMRVLKRDEKPWQSVQGIEFRSLTVEAFKGKEGECWDHHDAMIYRGPFSSVTDDDGHTFTRGVATAVCRKTAGLLGQEPYREHFHAVHPLNPVQEPKPFRCTGGEAIRDPRETKGLNYKETHGPAGCC